jgi:hypothetical protein
MLEHPVGGTDEADPAAQHGIGRVTVSWAVSVVDVLTRPDGGRLELLCRRSMPG